MFVVNPESLLNPEILIFALVNFFCALALSITAKKSPSASDVEVASSDKSTFNVTVPVVPPPSSRVPAVTPVISPTLIEPPNDVDVPLIVIALLASAEFGIELNLAFGTVPESKFEAFKEGPSMNPLSY